MFSKFEVVFSIYNLQDILKFDMSLKIDGNCLQSSKQDNRQYSVIFKPWEVKYDVWVPHRLSKQHMFQRSICFTSFYTGKEFLYKIDISDEN